MEQLVLTSRGFIEYERKFNPYRNFSYRYNDLCRFAEILSETENFFDNDGSRFPYLRDEESDKYRRYLISTYRQMIINFFIKERDERKLGEIIIDLEETDRNLVKLFLHNKEFFNCFIDCLSSIKITERTEDETIYLDRQDGILKFLNRHRDSSKDFGSEMNEDKQKEFDDLTYFYYRLYERFGKEDVKTNLKKYIKFLLKDIIDDLLDVKKNIIIKTEANPFDKSDEDIREFIEEICAEYNIKTTRY